MAYSDIEENPIVSMGQMLHEANKAAGKVLEKACKKEGYDRAYFDYQLKLDFRILSSDFKLLKSFSAVKDFEISQEVNE